MRLLTKWLREFVEIPADDRRLAQDLTMAGLAVDALETAENGEPVLEVDIPANRPDAMNHYGLAREASVVYDRDLKPYRSLVDEALKEGKREAKDFASVEIADTDLCARYSARVILGVKVGPSPDWVVRRLEAACSHSINNVTDVTNYLLLELGQPLHAFDLDLLARHKIVVRRARAGESLKTLDGVDRRFTDQHLVIADAEKPVAIAGVMGGLESGITERTKNVLLESAWFDPRSIRRAAKHFGMHTDASHRFERGADAGITATAADRAAALIREVAGGEILRGVLDVHPKPNPRKAVDLRRQELDRILGLPVPAADVLRILRRLGFRAGKLGRGFWKMIPPTFRLDIEREIDVIEEVARHYGFDRFPNRLPAWSGTARRSPTWAMERAVRETARGLGYDETISITLMAKSRTERFSPQTPVPLANPLSAEAAVLRTSGMPGVLAAVEWNLNRRVEGVRIFEIGNLFLARRGEKEGGYQEPPVLVLASCGASDFSNLKGDVESILDLFAHDRLSFDSQTSAAYFHPGRSARAVMDGETVARFGELHPELAAESGFRMPVLAAEFLLDRLYASGLRRPSHHALPRFPFVDRDFSLLLPEGTAFGKLEETVRGLKLPDVKEIQAVEIFRGGPVPAGRYSLLLRVRFQSTDRTLLDAEVNQSAAAIVAALEKQAGASLRG